MQRKAWLAVAVLVWAVPALAQWRTIEPGGATLCSDGSSYRFFVHPGDPAKLLVEFEGGGACWSGATCEQDVYTRRITIDPETARQQGLLQGIYDRGNPENPLRDFTHVYIPYCTGDLHWGNRTQSYTGLRGGYTVEHRGATNASAALTWTSDNVTGPSQVVVAGCSAGGYGATLWSARIAQRYPGATLAHLSDSAAGVVPTGFFDTVLAAWNVGDAWPGFIPSLALEQLDRSKVALPDLYAGIAGYYPLSAFSQFNRTADTEQIFFYVLSKGSIGLNDAAEWSAAMQTSIDRIEAENPNFHAFTTSGAQHCIINQASVYTTSAGGQRFVDWLRALVTTGNPGSVR
jgi:hypothetical protein